MDEGNRHTIPPIYVAMLGMMSAAAVLILYHYVAVHCCNNRRRSTGGGQRGGEASSGGSSVVVSTMQLIAPERTYGEEEGMVSGGESTCAVCLCEFKEGDAIRLLPECMHYFHAPCVDAWLRSHPSCPMCRAGTTPRVSCRPGDRGAAPTVFGSVLD